MKIALRIAAAIIAALAITKLIQIGIDYCGEKYGNTYIPGE